MAGFEAQAAAMPSIALDASQVLELRQYTLHQGKRDALVTLFDGRLVDPQEETGMRVLGQFRDVDSPDRFVWLRGFPDLASRASLLASFYGGPVWQANREAANATMIDSDDVLLLRPVDDESGLLLPTTREPGAAEASPGLVVATIYLLRAPVDESFLRVFDGLVAPVVAAAGAAPLARYRTEYGPNEFPRLPVREGEHAFVWMTSFAGTEAFDRYRAELGKSRAWARTVMPALEAYLASPVQELRLAPTSRSLLRHREPIGYSTSRTGGPHDFDFIWGDWFVASRRLRARGVGCEEWDEFPGNARAAAHLGGVANVDEITFPTRGWAGMTVRSFDPAARQWSIHWISSRTGRMDRGVAGGFAGSERGEFYGEDVEGDRPVKVRFVWTKLGTDAARWEQAFSYADGPWETNWVMMFDRKAS